MNCSTYRISVFFFIASLFAMVHKSHATAPDSIKSYYLHKYRAESAIMDADYRRAVKEYKKAYKYKMPNGGDLRNSFTAAYLCGDSAMAKAWQELGVLHGWNREGFEKTESGKSIKDESLYRWVNSNYDSLHHISLISNMPKVAKVMDSILAADQSVRPITNTKLSEMEMQKMLHVDSQNVAFLKKYIAQNGYPGFEKVGVFEEFNIPSTMWFILYHTRYISKELNELSRKAVLEGKMPPGEYAFIIDMQGDTPVYYQAPQWELRKKHPLALSSKQEAAINKLRAELLLEPLDEYLRKLAFQKDTSHQFFEFIPYMIFSEPY